MSNGKNVDKRGFRRRELELRVQFLMPLDI